MAAERAVSFVSEGRQLAGILHSGASGVSTGVVIVVGGPQYRVGSHRQFVHLARHLAAAGVPVLRFDVTGMGDSAGQKKPFDKLDTDIRAAIDSLFSQVPGLISVVLWGLCDGASAALIYAPQDKRVKGLVLVNPWLESSEARAKSYLVDYYLKRLLSRVFWQKLLSGGVNLSSATSELGSTLKNATIGSEGAQPAAQQSYQQRMLLAFQVIDIPLCWVLSGNDLTASEFERHYRADKAWQKAARGKRLSTERQPEADHTFSTQAWKCWLAEATQDFLDQHFTIAADPIPQQLIADRPQS